MTLITYFLLLAHLFVTLTLVTIRFIVSVRDVMPNCLQMVPGTIGSRIHGLVGVVTEGRRPVRYVTVCPPLGDDVMMR